MATDYLAELQRDLADRLHRLRTTRDRTTEDGEVRPPRVATKPDLPLAARIPARGHFEDDWRARPTPERPWPVILIHGTGDTNGIWQNLAVDLRADGWAVFAPEFGHRCTDRVEESAEQVGAYIDAVLQVTGARQVVLVGHSQGGILARYWMRVLDGAPKVRHLVTLGVPNHGTTMGGMLSGMTSTRIGESMLTSAISSWFGPSGFQLITGHPLLDEINADGPVEEGVGYTNIATRFDTIIQPLETCFLESDDPEADITNIIVQDVEPKSRVLHVDLPGDARVRRIVREALDAIAP
ncbi:triacylglycerol lipase precursor [Corynebacterium humireducens NBRC 106098 = DSM 45392]|uniref:Triacylglycerol lipase n=1 Tax=Corynebacterium humireducens NBRC 106098 = DSM 45392 TaxID=1223515 RepID=A0A0B5D4N5_9CORY|nr:triacylglycerol lipase [Corynebacterium humireducens]AJE31917.1 triacylglycerol lipase precursor [Corynebacterium humireducens NBRC 106098 = DSM 45392]